MTFSALRELIWSDPESHPWTSEPEVGQFLFALCKMTKARHVAEVGVWKGYTSLWLAEAVGWENTWLIDKENNLPAYYPIEAKRRLICGNAHDVIERMAVRFDLVFLDTDHQYESTMRELSVLHPMMELGGLVCCHDVMASPGVKQAVFASPFTKILLRTTNDKGLAVLQKTA